MTTETVATFIKRHIEISGKTHAQVAREVGLKAPNMISLIVTGRSKLPIGRVPAMAMALNVPVMRLGELAIKESNPELWDLFHFMHVEAAARDVRAAIRRSGCVH